MLTIVTAGNAGKLGKGKFNTNKLLGGPDIEHYRQAIALVVAETFEQARAAANLVRVTYTPEAGAYDLAAAKDAIKPKPMDPNDPSDSSYGDFDNAYAGAPLRFEATYSTPDQSHAMMEPHASTASIQGDKLRLDPVEFRIINDTQGDPQRHERPFSQRQLIECLRRGAERQACSDAR